MITPIFHAFADGRFARRQIMRIFADAVLPRFFDLMPLMAFAACRAVSLSMLPALLLYCRHFRLPLSAFAITPPIFARLRYLPDAFRAPIFATPMPMPPFISIILRHYYFIISFRRCHFHY
jgi:hypothetical protein